MKLSSIDQDMNIVRRLGNWHAFRYRHSELNRKFLSVLDIPEVKNAWLRIVEVTEETRKLSSILKEEDSIQRVYDHLERSIFLAKDEPARIVTVSKTLLMIAGFTPGLDSNVLRAIHRANPFMLACPGVWPFCLYDETLRYIASEQDKWEKENGSMIALDKAVGTSIGHITDKILFESGNEKVSTTK